ncbi:MAG: hypothetical protein V1492_04455 [Candidatus Micrarchaeota archaeon]
MDAEIISKTDNKLLERIEINAVVRFSGTTPNRKEVREGVATKLGLNPELTILKQMTPQFGSKTIKVVAHSYANKEKLMKTEAKYILVREGMAVKAEKKKKAVAAKKPATK